jgi:ABC-2 type transport system ATP-binding protein
MAIIEVKNVTKTFGPKVALDKLSLDIPEGKIFGLLGPNGAGKSTLIRIINRITLASEGEVYFQGHPITEEDVSRIGYLPEERGLYRKMKVGDQCMYLAQLKGMSSREAAVELKKWFVRFDIADWWNKKVEELSKGMAQKVQFITTIVHRPSLMILDEPFSGFDPVNAELIRREILRLKEDGATIILSTHNMESVEALCENIALINKGKLVVTGGTEEIRRQHGEDNVEIEYTDSFKERKQIVVPRPDVNAKLSELIAQDVTINSFKEVIPRMNDIFIKLVTEEE